LARIARRSLGRVVGGAAAVGGGSGGEQVQQPAGAGGGAAGAQRAGGPAGAGQAAGADGAGQDLYAGGLAVQEIAGRAEHGSQWVGVVVDRQRVPLGLREPQPPRLPPSRPAAGAARVGGSCLGAGPRGRDRGVDLLAIQQMLWHVGTTMRYVSPSATFIEDAYRRALSDTLAELRATTKEA
jgi:hypothetical protein